MLTFKTHFAPVLMSLFFKGVTRHGQPSYWTNLFHDIFKTKSDKTCVNIFSFNFCTKWNLEVLINGYQNELLKCPFIFRQCLSRTILSIACMGAWIAEWSSHSTLNIGTLRPEFEPR